VVTKTATIEAILEGARQGEELSETEAIALLVWAMSTLQLTSLDAIADLRQAADKLRQQQVGDTVTYVINRNINFTNICEQHCNFCAFRRDAGEAGAFWLDAAQMLEKTADAVERGATEICMQGGLNPQAKLYGASLPY